MKNFFLTKVAQYLIFRPASLLPSFYKVKNIEIRDNLTNLTDAKCQIKEIMDRPLDTVQITKGAMIRKGGVILNYKYIRPGNSIKISDYCTYHSSLGFLIKLDLDMLEKMPINEFIATFLNDMKEKEHSSLKAIYNNNITLIELETEIKKSAIVNCSAEYLKKEIIPQFLYILRKQLKLKDKNDLEFVPIEKCRRSLIEFFSNRTISIENAEDLEYFLENHQNFYQFDTLVISGSITGLIDSGLNEKFKHIRSIRIDTNDIPSIELATALVKHPENVRILDLSYSANINILDYFKLFSSITELDLRGSRITEECFYNSIGHFSNISALDITNTCIRNFSKLSVLKNLETIGITGSIADETPGEKSIMDHFKLNEDFPKLNFIYVTDETKIFHSPILHIIKNK